jgi:hypothetical protein
MQAMDVQEWFVEVSLIDARKIAFPSTRGFIAL